MNQILSKDKLVLVIEDEFIIRDTLKEALESVGYKVITAENGKDGLEILGRGALPDLILLDMMMPIMSGQAFLEQVSTDFKLAPIPVLVVSANADRLNITGAKAFMKKPPDLDLLLEMVEKYCKIS